MLKAYDPKLNDLAFNKLKYNKMLLYGGLNYLMLQYYQMIKGKGRNSNRIQKQLVFREIYLGIK